MERDIEWLVPPSRAVAVDDFVMSDRKKPGTERLDIASRQGSQRLRENLGSGILGGFPVAEPAEAIAIDLVEVAVIQRSECPAVASSGIEKNRVWSRFFHRHFPHNFALHSTQHCKALSG
jgi:hypothetical protein